MQTLIAPGGSAGGLEPLPVFLAALPVDIDAAVIHGPTDSPGHLAQVLSRAGPLPATFAGNGVL